MRIKEIWCVVLLTVSSGCRLFGGVQVTEIATTSGKPSNVASLVEVTQHGRPVSNLGLSAFRLSENGQALDSQSVDLRLLDPAGAASLHTVLLLDLGHGSPDVEWQQLQRAAETFIRSVSVRQSVTVLGFDGSPNTKLMGEFQVDTTGSGAARLDQRQTAALDPSRDLRGAVMQALDVLDGRLERTKRGIYIGSLVVFSRGPDVAGRVPISQFETRLDQTKHNLLLVSVAGDPADELLSSRSADGRIDAERDGELSAAFVQAAARIDQVSRSYYLISYCSPSRAGERLLRIEAEVVSDDLQIERGAAEVHFDSTGFVRGCNSLNVPRFEHVKKP